MELAEKQRNKTIAVVVKGKNCSPFFNYGLDTVIRPFWYDRGMLEGKCLECGFYRIGWALRNPRHQACPRCGVGLKITDGRDVFRGYSPFTGEKYLTNPPTNIPPSRGKGKDSA